MILAVREWVNRAKDEFSPGEYCGSRVAHSDLVRAALRYGIANEVHVFNDASSSESSQFDEDVGIAADLLKQFGSGRVKVRALHDFIHDLEDTQCLVLSAAPTVASLASLRLSPGCAQFPICSILHAVRWDNLMATYLYMTLLCSGLDTLVVTSTAGKRAAEAVFEETARLLSNRYSLHATERPTSQMSITHIPLAIDETQFAPRNREACRQLFSLRQDDIVLLYLGRLTEVTKADLEPLLITVRRLKEKEPTLVLIISGQDSDLSYSRQLQQYGAALGLGATLRILPNLSPILKPALYSASDIFVSPVDTVQETFGLSLLEAMASELPIVASDWSGYRDIVENGKTGFLVPTYWSSDAARLVSESGPLKQWSKNMHLLAQSTVVDVECLYTQLLLLISKPDMRRRFGTAGRQRVIAEFGWQKIIERYGNVWRQQLDRRLTPPDQIPPECRSLFDYNYIFNHYATATLNPQHLVILDNGVMKDAGAFQRRVLHLNEQGLLTQILRVAHECERGPRHLRQLLAGGTDQTLRAVLWLLKKGYCHLQQD